jgi:hypothetical protein
MSAAKSLSEWDPLPGEMTEAVHHCLTQIGVDPGAIDFRKLEPSEIQAARAMHAANCEVPG